jgi:hypothetical protein
VSVHAHARAEWRTEAGYAAGRRPKVLGRVLGVDPKLDRVASQVGPALAGKAFPGGDRKLGVGEIDAGDELGHGMLDLKARVHLDEVEAAVGEEKLDGSRSSVAEGFASPMGGFFHLRTDLGRDGRRGRLLDELLVPALDRAVALAERENRSLPVPEHLDLNMTGPEDRLLDVQRAVAEG